jgi:molybdopterin-guanine dinucleotide biosynthesis protein A
MEFVPLAVALSHSTHEGRRMFLMHLDFTAVLLAGGRASRLDGADKTAFRVGGATLLDRAIEAAQDATATAVVGLREGTPPPPAAILTREDPPWSGPVPALAGGLAVLPAPAAAFTLVLACDLPRAPQAVAALLEAAPVPDAWRDGVLAVDDDGRRQPLLAFYRTVSLSGRLSVLASAGPLAGLSLRRLLEGLDLVEVPVASELCADVDTAEDAIRLGVVDTTGGATG